MLTIGTGVGGGIICDGRPYRGFSGAAGELGHMVIDVNGATLPGELSKLRLPGGLRLRQCAGRPTRGGWPPAQPGSAFARAAAAGESLDGRLVTRLAQAGDADAVAVYEELGTLLGVGITNLVNAFNPELIVVGGSVAAAGDLLLEPARRVLAERGLRPPARPSSHRGSALRRRLRARRRRRPGAYGAVRRRLSGAACPP